MDRTSELDELIGGMRGHVHNANLPIEVRTSLDQASQVLQRLSEASSNAEQAAEHHAEVMMNSDLPPTELRVEETHATKLEVEAARIADLARVPSPSVTETGSSPVDTAPRAYDVMGGRTKHSAANPSHFAAPTGDSPEKSQLERGTNLGLE